LPDFSIPGARNSQKLQFDDIVFGSGFLLADSDAGRIFWTILAIGLERDLCKR
jgi:hypothetical protein